jgi:hypothetical protein
MKNLYKKGSLACPIIHACSLGWGILKARRQFAKISGLTMPNRIIPGSRSEALGYSGTDTFERLHLRTTPSPTSRHLASQARYISVTFYDVSACDISDLMGHARISKRGPIPSSENAIITSVTPVGSSSSGPPSVFSRAWGLAKLSWQSS